MRLPACLPFGVQCQKGIAYTGLGQVSSEGFKFNTLNLLHIVCIKKTSSTGKISSFNIFLFFWEANSS